MAIQALPLSTSDPDPRIVAALARLQHFYLAVVAALAFIPLMAWFVPALARHLSPGWQLMKVNGLVLILACALSLLLSEPRRAPRSVLVSRLLGLFITLVGVATVAEYAGLSSLHIDTIFAADSLSPQPGRMSLQAAWLLALLGIVLANLRARKRVMSHMVDALTLVLSLLVLTFISGYLAGVSRVVGKSFGTGSSFVALLSLSILTFLVFARRAEYGVFSILLVANSGGRIARLSAPFAILLPFLLSAARSLAVRFHVLPDGASTALSTSLLAALALCLVLLLSARSNQFEQAILELSVRDSLTNLYNRRGFYILSEQALRFAQRAETPFSVLFADVDNLKQINDQFGHDTGSQLLQEMAGLLTQTFRESDVISRIGGDEFVVAGCMDASAIALAAKRLEEAASSRNGAPKRPYLLDFSVGFVTYRDDAGETLEALLQCADTRMYQAKKMRQDRNAPVSLLADLKPVANLPSGKTAALTSHNPSEINTPTTSASVG